LYVEHQVRIRLTVTDIYSDQSLGLFFVK